ncbi:hypothetical protein COCMIDRAFT_5589 [Bipolaris oryzae ATCC 44560]|uniref:F-box domain-containing protein n=1 Tax=Bipolaris oryzae ATCC 44560 TaxID=930090 RepID=W6Z5G0_COCMI|nr:uncharacterized protein COCMIDRAFT_5589 [Bipolaris oryzae ATCC 44560]EUC45190.1 hypothetical protein COCMIDRAFT_5589 [Bipolaris oryzae ATCC 44560]
MAPTTRNVQSFYDFLAHSAEIRNFIYEFAIAAETPDTPEGDVLLRKADPKPYTTRPWKFFGLTQTCRQIRAEFRPLWMRNTSIRFMGLEDSVSFISTFMPAIAEFKHAPECFTIGTAYKVGRDSLCDITLLFRMDAFCPYFCLSFSPFEVIMGRPPPDERICPCCEEHFNPHTGEWSGTGIEEDCICIPSDADLQDRVDWEGFRDEELIHMDPLFEIQSASEAWWKDLQDDKISIYMTASLSEVLPRFRIEYKAQGPRNGSSRRLVRELLSRWGLRVLIEDYENVTFAVKYGESSEEKSGDVEVEVVF